MSKKQKKKKWLDRRSMKMQRKRKKTNKKGYASVKSKNTSNNSEKNVYLAEAPHVFSFIKNTEETNDFFLNIVEEMNKKIYKQLFYIDSSKVKEVTTDALVYILALLYNIKLNPVLKYSFRGNLPIEKEAEKVYTESGFMNYVKTRRAVMPQTDDKIQIITGNQTDNKTAMRICDFVNERFSRTPTFTKDLYSTLIELMSNTVSHAYNDNGVMVPYWYLYAIDKGEAIQFTFIDTGEGIPNTVRKKLLERLISVKDSELIYSAFMGDGRTETKLPNRGHGLPDLYNKVVKGSLQNFCVLSGKGCCKSRVENNSIRFDKQEFDKDIIGTIFQFEIANS